jgi:hypothetical protein
VAPAQSRIEGALSEAAATALHEDTTADREGVALRVVDGGLAEAS